MTSTTQDLRLQIALGQERFDPGLPILGGRPVENLFGEGGRWSSAGSVALLHLPDWLLGIASVEVAAHGGHDGTSHRIYADLLQAVHGLPLARIWNYVPDINALGPDGLENYGAFCRGRSLAFEDFYGAKFRQFLPAASAVGCEDRRLTVVFAATRERPRHFENPLQMPAYHYPQEYGPRPPSFARATTVPRPGGEPAIFVSGTAAIRGHKTVAPESTAAQLACTLENFREISRVCGLGDDLAAERRNRHFKVYLRHAADFATVQPLLDAQWFRPGDQVSYVRANICRAQLNVEIEATLL